MPAPILETALYAPVKAFLTAAGFSVKSEVKGCDIVALRVCLPGADPSLEPSDPPDLVIIVELKLRFSLTLVLQGIDRQKLTDRVYLAIPRPGRRRQKLTAGDPDIRRLCRMLGLGLMTVDPASGQIDILVEPEPYRPRKDLRATGRLIDEHRRRVGDPNTGGSTRRPLVTAYRQEALACAALLRRGPMTPKMLRAAASVPNAARILQRNVYGWFVRLERGIYALTPTGDAALALFSGQFEMDPAVSSIE